MAHLLNDWEAVGDLTVNQMIAVAAKYMHRTLKKEKKLRVENAPGLTTPHQKHYPIIPSKGPLYFARL